MLFKGSCRVYLNDIDVSDRCYEADELLGYVMLYRKKAEGHFFMVNPKGEISTASFTDKPVGVKYRGQVRIIRMEVNDAPADAEPR